MGDVSILSVCAIDSLDFISHSFIDPEISPDKTRLSWKYVMELTIVSCLNEHFKFLRFKSHIKLLLPTPAPIYLEFDENATLTISSVITSVSRNGIDDNIVPFDA